jgi:hypothetical protein
MGKTCKRVSMHENNWFKVAATKAILRSTSVNQQIPHAVTIFTANLDEFDYWVYILLLPQPHFIFSTPAL